MRVLVCGGRTYGELADGVDPSDERYWVEVDQAESERRAIAEALRPLWIKGVFALLIEGGAKGADRQARDWARNYRVPVRTFEAEWHKDGTAAGPKRNQRMIDEGKPDLVIAFPGGRGTADLVKRAKAAGIPVQEVPSFTVGRAS